MNYKTPKIRPDRALLIILAAISLLLLDCTPARVVIRKGIAMKEDQAASLDFDVAETLFKTRKYQDAAINFELLTNTYPNVSLAADALYRASQIHEILKDQKKATQDLEKLIINYPLSHIINDAGVKLGDFYLRAVKFLEARDVLSAVNLTPYEKKQQVQILNLLG